MKKAIRALTSGTVVMAIAYIIIGIVMVIYPAITMKTLVYYGAIALIVIGAVNILRYVIRGLRGGVLNNFMVTGCMMIIIGIVLLIKPELAINTIPLLLGLAILLDGLIKLQRSIDLARLKFDGWIFILLISALCIAMAIVIISNPFETATVLLVVEGISLIFSGVTQLVIAIIVAKKLKKYREEHHLVEDENGNIVEAPVSVEPAIDVTPTEEKPAPQAVPAIPSSMKEDIEESTAEPPAAEPKAEEGAPEASEEGYVPSYQEKNGDKE